MTAAGTAGHGTELLPLLDLASLGAHVVKSLAAFEWAGNPAPRLHAAGPGMLNAVGLQGPGVAAWRRDDLPALMAAGVTTVVSIWGRSVDDYARAAEALAGLPAERRRRRGQPVVPQPRGPPGDLRPRSASCRPTVIRATEACGRPRWAKLSPNTDRVVDVAAAAHDAGADGGHAVQHAARSGARPDDPPAGARRRRRRLQRQRRSTRWSCARSSTCTPRCPELPIVGVGGVGTGWDAVELLLAGASAVQVGTATFAEPPAPARVLAELEAWMERHGVATVGELIGAAHR